MRRRSFVVLLPSALIFFLISCPSFQLRDGRKAGRPVSDIAGRRCMTEDVHETQPRGPDSELNPHREGVLVGAANREKSPVYTPNHNPFARNGQRPQKIPVPQLKAKGKQYENGINVEL